MVVLTKADKSDNSVSKAVLESVISALRDGGVSRTPVLLTSATSKLGRDGMWRYVGFLTAMLKAFCGSRSLSILILACAWLWLLHAHSVMTLLL